jgi:hypothetical protein
MHITLYHRSYLIKGAPVSMSFDPFPANQRHTFTASGVEHEAKYGDLRVVVPDDAKVGAERGQEWPNARSVLNWIGDEGPVASTALEVFELARTSASGFRIAE